MPRRVFLGLALAPLLLAAVAFGQPLGVIRGVVVDGNGAPVRGATVKAGPAAAATTDAGGLFTLKVKPGTHEVVASHAGYKPDRQSVTVRGGETKDVCAILSK